MSTTTPTRPVLRYHGGKWMLAPWIISHFPAHRIYTETFGGAASVLLRKPRTYSEVYNDLDGEVVNLFRVARDMGDHLRVLLEMTPFSRDEFRLSYQASADPIEQARRTVVRAFMGFGSNAHNRNTGFRSNSNRSGTTPAHDWRNYPDAFMSIIDRLRGVVVENRAAAEVLVAHDGPTTLHYVDPPYVASTRDAGADYRHEMTEDDHRQLGEVLHGLSGMVFLSGYACDLYDLEIYPDWFRVERQHRADGAALRCEVLWLNPAASAALHRQAPTLNFSEAAA